MKVPRLVRVNELLKRELATLLYREMVGEAFDFAAVTITDVEVSPDLRRARVWVSVRGDEATVQRVFAYLSEHRVRLQSLCHRRVRLKYTPVFQFERDLAIERGDRVLEILSKLEQPETSPRTPPPPDSEPSQP